MRHANILRGFTMIEFIMVVAISSILLVGLSAIVEAPRAALEREQYDASPSSADRMLARMEQDVRFASDIRVPNSNRAEVDLENHTTAIYEWDGVDGGVVSLTDPSGTHTVLTGVQQLAFSLNTASIASQAEDHPVTTASVETSSFTDFTLSAGYQLDTEPQIVGLEQVDVKLNNEHVCFDHRLGIAFTAAGLTEPASPTSVRLQAERDGSANLIVRIYEAYVSQFLPDLVTPNRFKLIASATVLNGALPIAVSDIDIPMACVGKLEPGKRYFLELLGDDGSKHAINVPYFVIGDAAAVEKSDVGLLRSTSKGLTYDPLGSLLWLAQARFSQQATETKVTVTDTPETIEIPTAINMKFVMKSRDAAGQEVRTSFPCENKVTLVNQQ